MTKPPFSKLFIDIKEVVTGKSIPVSNTRHTPPLTYEVTSCKLKRCTTVTTLRFQESESFVVVVTR